MNDPRQMDLARQLLRKLNAAAACVTDESRQVAQLRVLYDLAQGSAPALSRFHYSPGHFTASALVLSPDRAQLLLIRHKKLKLWLQPGGHIEATDPTIALAALRELKEETQAHDIEVQDALYDVDIHTIPAWKETPEHQHFDLRVLFVAGSSAIQAGEEVHEARWFSLEKLAWGSGPLSKNTETDESVRRVARQLLNSG